MLICLPTEKPKWEASDASKVNSVSICEISSQRKIEKISCVWWCTPLIPKLRGQKQTDLCEVKSRLVYIASSEINISRMAVGPFLFS